MPPPHHWLHRYAACQVCHPWFQFFHNTHQSCPQCPRKLPTMPTHHQSCPGPLSLTTALPSSEKKIRADTATRTSKFVTTISHWFTLYVWLPSNTVWSYIVLQVKIKPFHWQGKWTANQGGRSCAKAQRVFAEKFGFGQKNLSPNIRYIVALFMIKIVAI